MRQDLAKGLVMARSRIPIPPDKSFNPVFRQAPGPADKKGRLTSPFYFDPAKSRLHGEEEECCLVGGGGILHNDA
jgi:hypothetical protein